MEVQSPRYTSSNSTQQQQTAGPHSNNSKHDATNNGGIHVNKKPLTLLPLVALIFYDVSGGPFGIEDAVSAGGALLAIVGFMVLPLAWSVPEALITSELATAFPENSGFVAWVTAAFGPWWGFQEGFWKWLSGVTDNAVYPVIFLTYLQQVVPVFQESGYMRALVLVGVNLGLTYMNYRGLHVVGKAAIAMTAFTLLPFVLMCLLGIPHVQPKNWLQVPEWNSIQWIPFLNVMFWNLNYWDTVSTLAGEVERPAKTFPKALGIAVVLVVTSYVVPLLVGIGVVATSGGEWTLGYFADVAHTVGGGWLAWWIVLAAAVSQLGQFQAEMSTDSYQLLGMAERGFLPEAFARRSEHGTPTLAIIFSSLGIMTMASFDFLVIVELLNVVYCMAELLEFLAFIWLRIKYPDLNRPYKIPLSTGGCILMLIPAMLLLGIMLVLPVVRGQWEVLGFTVLAVLVGAGLYPFLQVVCRERGWFRFTTMTPDDFKAHLYTLYSSNGDGEYPSSVIINDDGDDVDGGSGDDGVVVQPHRLETQPLMMRSTYSGAPSSF
jgi:amino acid transporter